MRRLDFLRQIVNVILAEENVEGKVADTVKDLVAKAELKYRFSAFGEKPENLAKYLNSIEFEDVVKLLIGENYEKALYRILELTEKNYSDIEEVRLAIKRVRDKIGKIKRELSLDKGGTGRR